MSNIIALKGHPLQQEFIAVGAITPGHLVDRQAGVVHATADGNTPPTFAVENPWVEPTAGVKNIDHAYAIGDTVIYGAFKTGQWVYALLEDSNVVTAGAPLASAGDGTLKLHAPQAVDEAGAATFDVLADAIVGYALEAVTTSGAVLRIKIEVA